TVFLSGSASRNFRTPYFAQSVRFPVTVAKLLYQSVSICECKLHLPPGPRCVMYVLGKQHNLTMAITAPSFGRKWQTLEARHHGRHRRTPGYFQVLGFQGARGQAGGARRNPATGFERGEGTGVSRAVARRRFRPPAGPEPGAHHPDRKSTRLNSSHEKISYAV